MPFSKILHVFQTISLVALFILPISNRRPLFISSEFNSVSKHRSLCWMPYFAPTNFTLSEYLASKHFGDSACFGSKNLRDSAHETYSCSLFSI